jgi:preprotein translocase subunit YajC
MLHNILQLFPVAQQSPGFGNASMLIFFGGIMVIMYVFMIRPQSKQRKEHQAMLAALKKGDKVVTIGGIVGMISNVKDNVVVVKIADNVKIEMRRSGIAQVITSKEDIKEEGQ